MSGSMKSELVVDNLSRQNEVNENERRKKRRGKREEGREREKRGERRQLINKKDRWVCQR